MPPETIRKLAENCAREVHVAAGEDVFRGRVREDDVVVLVAGAVALGDDPGDVRRPGAREPTVVTRPGTTLNSLLDVLEGSLSAHAEERDTRAARATAAVGVEAAGVEAVGAEAEAEAAAEAEVEAEAAVEAAATLDAASASASAIASATPAGIKRLGAALAEAAATERRAESDADADEGSYPASRLAPGAPPPTAVAPPAVETMYPNPKPSSPLGVRVSSRSPAATPDHSYPTTPTRGSVADFAVGGDARDGARTPGGTPDRSGRAGPPGSVAPPPPPPPPPRSPPFRISAAGPAESPRLRARRRGRVRPAAISTRDFHRAAGFQLGVQAPAMRLAADTTRCVITCACPRTRGVMGGPRAVVRARVGRARRWR